MTRGKLPPSFDTSPGTFQIPGLRAPRGYDSPIPPDALLPEPSTFDEEEGKEQVVAPAAGAQGQMDSNSQLFVANGRASVGACAMRDLELKTQRKNEGKAPSSSSSRPGAFPIQGLRASHDSPSPSDVMAPVPGSSGPDEEEYREEVLAPAVGAQGNTNVGSHDISVVAHVVQGQEDLRELVHAEILQPQVVEKPRKWRQPPKSRAVLAGSCFLALLVVVATVVLVMYLTKASEGKATPVPTSPPVSLNPTAVPTLGLTPEEIACDFIGRQSLSDCRRTLRFDSLDGGDSTNGFTIPSEIGLLTQLTALKLSGNALQGTIPSSISKLTRLTWLSFDDNQLAGSIPFSFSQLTLLSWLTFDKNKLRGSIPSSISELTLLTQFSFGVNELTGSIPSSISQLSRLTLLAFTRNSLTGSIPASISQLSLLRWLSFDANQLDGSIPESISQLTQLSWLSLYENDLTGIIPSSFCNQSINVSIGFNDIECTCCDGR